MSNRHSLVNQPYFSGLRMRARKGGGEKYMGEEKKMYFSPPPFRTRMRNPEKYGWFTRLQPALGIWGIPFVVIQLGMMSLAIYTVGNKINCHSAL